MFARCAVLAVCVLAVLAGETSGAIVTRAVTFSPYDADGSLRARLHVSGRSGDCWTTPSAPVARRAFRCFGGDVIHDPCFEPPAGVDARAPVVDCVGAPWKRTVLRLHLKARPDFEGAANPHPTLPWGMRLADGRRCLFAQGASGTDSAGRRLNYVCTLPGGGRELWLFGSVRRSQAAWRIRAGDPDPGAGLPYRAPQRWVTILAAWR